MLAPIYVETRVHADLDRVWRATQEAAAHTRWDLRFTKITDMVAQDPTTPRCFTYALHLPGRTIAGTGTSVGERHRPDGSCTSALRFGSPDPLSLIRRGSGWWRYVPTPDGVRFLTGYDYEPGWGRLGAVVDRLVFRRLMGWATAWSFDRLRLWVDEDVSPEAALRRGLLDAGLRCGVLAAAIRGATTGRPRLAILAALLLLLPPTRGTPRASRCLRVAPDRTGRTAPRSLATLSEPQ